MAFFGLARDLLIVVHWIHCSSLWQLFMAWLVQLKLIMDTILSICLHVWVISLWVDFIQSLILHGNLDLPQLWLWALALTFSVQVKFGATERMGFILRGCVSFAQIAIIFVYKCRLLIRLNLIWYLGCLRCLWKLWSLLLYLMDLLIICQWFTENTIQITYLIYDCWILVWNIVNIHIVIFIQNLSICSLASLGSVNRNVMNARNVINVFLGIQCIQIIQIWWLKKIIKTFIKFASQLEIVI